ncbi:MAG: AMP-binding protein [Chloroflexi bacterium]|nr:AMP-binding protein [Chloroflexota bacterium]
MTEPTPPTGALTDWQARRLRETLARLYDRAPAFRARLEAASVSPDSIRSADDLNAIPILRKDRLIELQAADPPFGGFLACAPDELKRIFQSPGPLYDPEPRVADYWRWAPALRAAGFQPGDVVFNGFGYHLTPAGAMFEEGLWAVGCAVIPGGVGNQEQQARLLHDLGVTGYVGLPSYLKALLEKAAALNLPLKLQKAFVTAEPLPPSLRVLLNGYGLTVRQGYGTAECGNLGYECEQQNGWHIPDNAWVQVCDLTTGQPLPPGQPGEVVATLFTPEYALVRFGTGDLSSLNVEPCPCGRASHRLMGWQGRAGDAVKVRGMFLHPRQLHQFMAGIPEVMRWQAVVTRREHKDHLTLRVIPASGADSVSLLARLARAARDAIKFHLTVEIVADLPADAPPIQDERTWD